MAFGRKGREEERKRESGRERERRREKREEGRRERKQRDRLATGERAAAEAKKERKATRTERRRRDDGETTTTGRTGRGDGRSAVQSPHPPALSRARAHAPRLASIVPCGSDGKSDENSARMSPAWGVAGRGFFSLGLVQQAKEAKSSSHLRPPRAHSRYVLGRERSHGDDGRRARSTDAADRDGLEGGEGSHDERGEAKGEGGRRVGDSKKEKESGASTVQPRLFSPDLDLDLDLDLRSSLFFFSRARAAAEITQI